MSTNGTDGGGLVGPMADTRGGGQLDVRTFQSPDIWAIGHVRLRVCLTMFLKDGWKSSFNPDYNEGYMTKMNLGRFSYPDGVR